MVAESYFHLVIVEHRTCSQSSVAEEEDPEGLLVQHPYFMSEESEMQTGDMASPGSPSLTWRANLRSSALSIPAQPLTRVVWCLNLG